MKLESFGIPFLAAFIATVAAAQGGPRAALPDGIKALRDVPYVANGHEKQKLDLYLPEASSAPRPLLIWIHGGAWQAGSKDQCPALRGGWFERGYAVASVEYRFSQDAIFPAQIEDCKAAIRWLRAHAKEYSLDPQRFGVWGSSAGGHLVALLGTSGDVKEFDVGANLDQSSRVQAVCDYYGPTDLIAFVTRPGYESHSNPSSPESKLLGGLVMEHKDKAARANPITFVSKDDPPFLIVHGDKDPTVAPNQSQLLFDALKKTGVSAHLHIIHGAGHGGPGFSGKNIDDMVATFFDKKLKGTPSAGNAPEALTTESTATLTTPERASQPGVPNRPGGQRIPWEAVLARDDANHDGKISRDEFKGPPALFDRLDRNHDGFITREEHEGLPQTPQSAPPGPSSPGAAPSATAPPATSNATNTKGFKLDGDHWTYQDGEFSMSGILLKPAGKGPFPAVLISHGMGGNADSFGMQKAREMVKWGFVCIAPNYTHAAQGAPMRGGPPQRDAGASAENIRRAHTCFEILRGMSEVDGKRLAAYGHSMGGFVTIGFAADAPDVLKAAAITGSGISPRAGYAAPSNDAAAKIRTPFLMMHGGNDTTVRPDQSAALKEILDHNKVPTERRVFEGEGHPIDQTKRDEVFAEIRAWFVKQGVLKA